MGHQTEFLSLGASRCRLQVDLRSGMLDNFQFSGSEKFPWRDYYVPWNDARFGMRELHRRRGGVRVTDELTGCEYRDDFGPGATYYNETRKSHYFPKGAAARISAVKTWRRGETTFLAFSKQFSGAPFALDYRFAANPREIEWQIGLRLLPGRPPRSARLEFVLPNFGGITLKPAWSLWAPVAGAPFPYASSGGYGHDGGGWELMRFPYASAKGDMNLVVPVITSYSEREDCGLALAAPFELHKPELIFEVDKLLTETRVIYGNLGLHPGRAARAVLLMHAHAGDWRPALGWLFDRYREYFTAGDRKIVRQEGPMCYNFPVLPEKTVQSWRKRMRFSWTEVLYAPTFGDYVPAAGRWVCDMFKSAARPDCEIQLDRPKLRAYLRMLRRRHVASFAYFNVGECESALAEKKYPESLITLDHGHRAWQWPWPDGQRRNWEMNPDPRSRWGRDMLRQLETMFKTYPELDGIFLDQLCYRAYDFSRDDGVTMLHNRPCFDTRAVAPAMVEKIAALLRRYKRTAFANGPNCIEVQKGLDGIMAEGRLAGLAQYAHICLAKPVMILTYGCPLDRFEAVLKYCLKYGAFPDVRDHLTMRPRARLSAPEQDLYDRYLPLLELLRGRRWVLRAHALKLPEGYDGNIFLDRHGRHVVTAFPAAALGVDRRNWIARIITVRLPPGLRPRRAVWRNTSAKFRQFLPVKPAGGQTWQIELPGYADASVLVLEK